MAPSLAHAPAAVRLANPLTAWLIRRGLPLGPNVLVTVRGRVSGQPRSFPLAVMAFEGRRYVIGAYGDVQWTKNLRAAGEADVTIHDRTEHVTARELSTAEGERFFGTTLPTYISHFPLAGRLFAKVFFRIAAPDILSDPAGSAAKRPVFELRSAEAADR